MAKESFFCSFESFLLSRAPSTKFLRNSFLIQKKRVSCHVNIETTGFPSRLKVSSTSSLIK